MGHVIEISVRFAPKKKVCENSIFEYTSNDPYLYIDF